MTDAQLAALRTELLTDPQGYGYAEWVADGSHQALADLLNWPRDGVTPARSGKPAGPAVSVRRADITPLELLEAIDTRDFVATPAAASLAWFQAMLAVPEVRLLRPDGTDTLVIANLKRLITLDTNGSRTRLAALAGRVGSRAEALAGPGTLVQHADVSAALHGG